MRAIVRACAAGVLVAAGCAAGDAPLAAPQPAESPAEIPLPHAAQAAEGAELLGTTPPEWEVSGWLNSPPLTLAGLRGKVVLMRWFMGESCPFCSASAPSLRALDARYRARGLVVVGMYHHKDGVPLTDELVAAHVRHFGFTFPVAIDRDWRTLHRFWLDSGKRDFTSVSLLLDRAGVLRHIHPGGTLALEAPDGQALVARIEALLGP